VAGRQLRSSATARVARKARRYVMGLILIHPEYVRRDPQKGDLGAIAEFDPPF
jgi:hypothetical protein